MAGPGGLAFIVPAVISGLFFACGACSNKGRDQSAVGLAPSPKSVAESSKTTETNASDAAAITPRVPFARIDDAVAKAIAENKLPGCVVVVGRRDQVLFRRAYGLRAIVPEALPMTSETIFDLASLTKPIATATSIMILAERGKLALDQPVARYIPEFGARGKSKVTLRQVLTHVSGLPAVTPKRDYADGKDAAFRHLFDLRLVATPGERFIYSDVGFIVLEEVVRRLTGKDLAAFSASNIFGPLGMNETGFLLSPDRKRRAAPTEMRDGQWIQGDVHDPRAFLLGGIAGNAGLFSTADDVALFAQTMLGAGELHGARILSATSVSKFFAPHDVPGGIRAIGWDVQSAFSTNRGVTFSRRAVGHGGYTGTSLWIDPVRDLFVLFLSNRVHPDGKGAINALAAEIAGYAASDAAPSGEEDCKPLGGQQESAHSAQSAHSAKAAQLAGLSGLFTRAGGAVMTGLDVLRAEHFERLAGAKIGLITNVTGRARDGTSAIELFQSAENLKLVKLFAPEHGLGSDREGRIETSKDEKSGLPIFSLYAPARPAKPAGSGTQAFAPPPGSLADIDTLVFDMQDVGARFYTYAATMRYAMESARDHGLRFVVLDRPNPIDGLHVAGPILEPEFRSALHSQPLPIRHGMTIGELAEMFNADDHMGVTLQVVPIRGWNRGDYYDATGLGWVNPSPNLRSVTEELLYPAVGILEGTNVSVGRGTENPFEVIGAPWIDSERLATALQELALPGVSFSATTYSPSAAPYNGESCGGVRLAVLDRAQFEPVRTGVAIAIQLRRLYPKAWHPERLGRLLGSKKAVDAVLAGRPLADVEATWADTLASFQLKRAKYLLYPDACSRE